MLFNYMVALNILLSQYLFNYMVALNILLSQYLLLQYIFLMLFNYMVAKKKSIEVKYIKTRQVHTRAQP